MKQAPDHLVKLIQPIVEGLGYEFVGIEYNPHPKHGVLRVYIDNEAGIIVDDCSKVSHQISGVLDVEDPIQGNYQLELSSPGSDRPLFNIEQFEQFIGHIVKVSLFKPVNNRRKIVGRIQKVEQDMVQIEESGQVFDISFKSMSKANLEFEDDSENGGRGGK
jgi:ribosome maturation factor RimP